MLEIDPRLQLPDTDAVASTLPVDTGPSRADRTALAGSTGQLAFCLPWHRPAMVTAPRQETPATAFARWRIPDALDLPRSARSVRMPDGPAEFPAETWDMEEAIAAIAAEVGNTWSSSL